MSFQRLGRGFTLLELLVVLVVLTVMAQLVTPHLLGRVAQQEVEHEAHSFKNRLQQLIDRQWMSSQATFLQVKQQQVVVWQLKADGWSPREVIYELSDAWDDRPAVDSQRLKAAGTRARLAAPMALYILESGEYLPFRWRITDGHQHFSIVGDGVNVLSVE